MRLHFEGLDLAGKSTVCRRLVDRSPHQWVVMRNSITALNPVQQAANDLRKLPGVTDEVAGWVYFAALLQDLASPVPDAPNLIQDSTILLRSIAYHSVMGNRKLADAFTGCLEAHPRFDHSFVCVASRETRLRRLAIRRQDQLGPEDFLVRDRPELFLAMEAKLVETAREHFGATLLRTDHLESDENLDGLLAKNPDLAAALN